MLEQRIRELKAIIAENDGRNAADRRFARAVDELISAFYDDIGQISDTPARALFDLFVIKVLYVGRGSCHADVIDYLAGMLETFLHARELFPPDASDRPQTVYYSDALGGDESPAIENRYETYRRYADRALFLSGVFPSSTRRRRRARQSRLGGQARVSGVDASYYITTGKAMYQMASREDEAEEKRQRETLARLAQFFEIYVEALSEMSQRYIMGFDFDLLADKMLDSINAFRATQSERALTDARRYATILRLDVDRYPRLFDLTA
jgi:hypothetical protein